MKHRIRAAGLIEHNDQILLVKHVDPKTNFEWWVPPGGGVEESDCSILDTIRREVFEETGLNVQVDDTPLFVREFFDTESNTLNIELFFKALYIEGELTIQNIYGNGKDELYIKDVKWFAVEDLQTITVFPEVLKQDFGRNLSKIYLGRQK